MDEVYCRVYFLPVGSAHLALQKKWWHEQHRGAIRGKIQRGWVNDGSARRGGFIVSVKGFCEAPRNQKTE